MKNKKESPLRGRSKRKESTGEKARLRLFFKVLFQRVNGYVEIKTIKEGQAKRYFYPTSDLERLTSDLTSAPEFKDTNVFFGTCPRKERKGKEENVNEIACVWVDLDYYKEKTEKLRTKKLKKLKAFDLRPSIVINSGRGLQLYWLLDKVYPIENEKERLRIKGYVRGLSRTLGGDPTFDLVRVLRVPGTVNFKQPNNPLPVELSEFYPDRKITLKDLEPYWTEVKETGQIKDIEFEAIPERFFSILAEDTQLKAIWQGKRPDLKDQSPSSYDMALANWAIAHGFTDSQTASILRERPPKRKKTARVDYLARTIGEARRYWDKRKEEPMEDKEFNRTQEKWINKKMEVIAKEVFAKEKVKIKTEKEFNPRPYSEYILKNYNLKYDQTKRFWWYDKATGIWEDSFALRLNDILRKGILKKEDLKSHRVNEILEDLKGLCYEKEIPPEPPDYLIPFKNKIYDLRDGKTLDFSPEHFFINKLGVNYNPHNEACPNIDKLFKEIVLEEDTITLYEIIAYCFYRGYPYPKAFMLYGNGANGKSTFAKVVARVLGDKNVSSVSLNTLEESSFGTSQLYGRLANINPEMGYGVVKSANTLKKLTGSDLVAGERKFKEPFYFVNYAKLIFLSNEIPWSKDKSFAFYRRIFLLEFPNRFEIKLKANPFIVDRIPEQEFEGLAYKCLKILKSFTTEERLFVFTQHKKTEDIMKEYERISDPLGLFLEEFTEVDPDGNIPVRAFYDEFKKFQKQQGLRVWSDKMITSVMTQKGFVRRTLRVSTSIEGNYSYFKAYLELTWKNEK